MKNIWSLHKEIKMSELKILEQKMEVTELKNKMMEIKSLVSSTVNEKDRGKGQWAAHRTTGITQHGQQRK